MINTIFHFVNDPTFDYQTAVNNGDISEYTIVFNSADHSIYCKGTMFGRMSRADMAETLGNISDLIPVATDSTLGGIKIGYTSDTDQHSRRYGVVLDSNNKAYVEVPWTDTIPPVFDDSLLIQLINLLRQRIDDYITQQTQLISERTLTLFNDTLWVTNNLLQGLFGHWIKETDVEYMRQYGVWDYEYDPSTIVYSAWLYNDAGTTSLGTGKVMFTGNELSGLKEIKITECTDSTLVNTTYYMVSSFAADGESLYQLFTNTFATSGKAIKLQFYSGTPLTDPVTGEPLISIKTSVVQQQADSIYQRVGMVIGDVDAINTWQGNIDNWKNNTAAEKSYVTTTIGNLELLVGINPQTGAISSVTNLSNLVADVDASTKAVEKAVLATLDMKALKNSDGTFEAITDLAAFYEDHDGYSLYSGLNNRVSTAEDTITSQGSLITTALTTADLGVTDAAAAKNAADAAQSDLNAYKQTIASAGFATTAWVQNNTDASGAASTAETNAKGYADTKVAGASADMFAAIDEVCAGVGVSLTKHVSDGTDNHAAGEIWYDSSVSIAADNINLNGQTNFKNAVGGFIKTDVLEAGVADIKARLTVGGSDPAGAGTSGSITMKNASDGTIGIWDKDKLAVGTTSSPSSSNSAMLVNADGSGSLSKGNISWNANGDVSVNGTGQFNGDVYANQFRAGGTSTFNITVESDAINFNYGSTRQAWFSTKKLEMNSSGEIVDTGNDAPQGFYLYMISPRTGNLVTIDFESGMFVEVTNGTVTVHTDSNTVKEISAGSSGAAIVSNKTVYYTTDTSGSTPVNTYYWNTECTNQITGNLSDASHNYYIVVGDKYVVVNEDTGTGRSPYMLRRVTIYQPVKYDGNAHRLIPYGDRVYVIDKGTVSAPNRYFVTSTASTAATLYNTSVYMENTTTTLDNMPSSMKLTSGSGSVQVYVATKSAGSSIPTQTNTISIFTPGSGASSSVMTKVDYTA